jgi:hypothetical protein
MTNTIHLIYSLDPSNIDKLIEDAVRLRDSTRTFREQFDSVVSCELGRATNLSSPYAYRVTLEATEVERLETGLEAYISLAGLPSQVEKGSDYDTCKRVLQQHGQRLRKGGLMAFLYAGPYVAPL